MQKARIKVGHETRLQNHLRTVSPQHHQRIAGNPGDKVPSVRVLASELGVARKTVETAWAILVGEGYLVSQAHAVHGLTRTCRSAMRKNRADSAKRGCLPQYGGDAARSSGILRLGIPSLDAFPTRSGCC